MPRRQVLAGAELAAAGALLAWNAAVNRVVPSPAYVPANLAAAGLSLAAARQAGVSAAELGLDRQRAGRGLRVGLAAAAPVVAVVAIGAALPATRRFLVEDRRATTGGAGYALYHTLVRIPLGTAVAEEALFRGALLGLLTQRHPRARAVAVSSALFGCWHVLPTLDTLALNPLGATVGDRAGTGGAVLASVAVTALAGLGFSWLRFRGDSVVAPVVAHAALNSSAFAAARLVSRL
ncbi:MAG TPA: CPBP family intramembrane glutamic endopeptidase [Actinomycetota bacterium]|nr:CPBP family intramembrane glutamic endopeptidase [Actinomycetota bacterium]